MSFKLAPPLKTATMKPTPQFLANLLLRCYAYLEFIDRAGSDISWRCYSLRLKGIIEILKSVHYLIGILLLYYDTCNLSGSLFHVV